MTLADAVLLGANRIVGAASMSAALSAVASESRIPVVTSQVARFFQRSQHRVDVTEDLAATAGQGGRLNTGEIVDLGVQPVSDAETVAADLIGLDDAQRLVGQVIGRQRLATRSRREVLEGLLRHSRRNFKTIFYLRFSSGAKGTRTTRRITQK